LWFGKCERQEKLKSKINKCLNRLGKWLKLSISLDISLARNAHVNTHKRDETNPLKMSENMNQFGLKQKKN
jgi:uncharacterized protein YktB (UPF0637 family)